MKKLLVILFLIIVGGTLFYFSPFLAKGASFAFTKLDLPRLLGGNNKGDVAASQNRTPFWKPDSPSTPSKEPYPIISAKSTYVVNLTTNTLLMSKNPDLRTPVGSVQKIVTGMVTLDHLDPNSYTTISKYAASKTPDSMGLYPGEKLTITQLLYGLILVSGNDAAVALAEAASGSEAAFVKEMNKKAAELGLNNTRFVNPNGLDEGFQYSSAFDIAAISVKLIRDYPLLAKIAATREITFPSAVTEVENHKDYVLVNNSPTLNLEGYLGIKPGYTPEARLCLVTLVQRGNHQFLIVVLGSEDRKGDSEVLLQFAQNNTL